MITHVEIVSSQDLDDLNAKINHLIEILTPDDEKCIGVDINTACTDDFIEYIAIIKFTE